MLVRLRDAILLAAVGAALAVLPGDVGAAGNGDASATRLATLEDVLIARDSGDVEALEQAFDRLEAALKAGEITSRRYNRPWLAFSTGKFEHANTVDEWAAAFPQSPHPHAAKGRRAQYVGLIFRGEETVSRTPRGAMIHARREFRAARSHYTDALSKLPD
ncbi:MAG: hypothetical protein AAF968_16925, partial [Pseudomonadota bacterium]